MVDGETEWDRVSFARVFSLVVLIDIGSGEGGRLGRVAA